MHDNLTETDQAIVKRRIEQLDGIESPRVGDWIYFADGVERRISHVWPADWHEDNIARLQTSDGGSFYLGEGYVSFSGGLFQGVKADTLTLGDALNYPSTRLGSVWIFHNDQARAHNGVHADVFFRVYVSTENAPS